MIFPSVSDIAVATLNATFGFPEVRRGVLPGLVSVHTRRCFTDKQCKRLMLTADTFDSADAACTAEGPMHTTYSIDRALAAS